jgi:hypothetical protein
MARVPSVIQGTPSRKSLRTCRPWAFLAWTIVIAVYLPAMSPVLLTRGFGADQTR